VLLAQSQPILFGAVVLWVHDAILSLNLKRVNLIFNGLRQKPAVPEPLLPAVFACHNRPTKGKVTLSFARVLYGSFITSLSYLVPSMGAGFSQSASDGFGAPCRSQL
jgi:hypothetical protein